VSCEECERLTRIYLAAISRNNETAAAMANSYNDEWPDAWREEMKEIRTACEEALRDLDQHRREHGC
jgi:queuine/archaeosine tRNA-ribosyltransferase